MNKLILIACLLAVTFVHTCHAAWRWKYKSQLRDAVECSPRNGLPNFFAKCEKGGTIKVGYIGGSITCQHGWRVQSLELLRKIYPNVKFEEINAAIGGTGSDFGVYRLQTEVLNKKPDLLFVEFGVNDNAIKSEEIINRSMEGIIRQTWNECPNCDICFVYPIVKYYVKLLQEGKYSLPISLHEKIADHYGIPSIHMGMEVAKLEKEGKLEIKAPNAKIEQIEGKELDMVSGIKTNRNGKIPFSRDGTHPYIDTGHRLYTKAIKRSLPKIIEASKAPKPHSNLPSPLADYVSKVSYLPADKLDLQGDWTRLDNPAEKLKNPYIIVPVVWRGKPGSTLTFKFKGKNVLLYNLTGPGTGVIEMTVDGKSKKVNIFFRFSGRWFPRPVSPTKGMKLDKDKVHTLTIKVLPDKLDKRKLVARVKRERTFDRNPDAFIPNDFYIGGAFVEGEFVDIEK